MYFSDTLIACPSCNCHARPSAAECPHCGAPLRRADGTVPRTAGAILLGLIVATAGCSGGVETGDSEGTTNGSSGSSASAGTGSGGGGGSGTTTSTTTTTKTGGCGGFSGADYGVPPTCATASASSSSGGTGGSH
jgi:hypothetical protein